MTVLSSAQAEYYAALIAGVCAQDALGTSLRVQATTAETLWALVHQTWTIEPHTLTLKLTIFESCVVTGRWCLTKGGGAGG